MIGKPYSGKPNVRFDEGELEIEPLATTPALYSTALLNPEIFGSVFQVKYYSGQITYTKNTPSINMLL